MQDPDFLGRVKPITLQRYQAALLPFTTWALQEGLHPKSPQDWDEALLDFRALHCTTMTKAKFTTLAAVLDCFQPQIKGHQAWCKIILLGWSRPGELLQLLPEHVAGFATDLKRGEASCEEIRQGGRWLNDSSL